MIPFPGKRGSYHFGAKGTYYDPKRGHTGEDYLMPENTPVPSRTDGIILNYRFQKQMGNCLYVKDPNGNINVYAHLNESKVKIGQEVKVGQIVALSGNTGTATDTPHVHNEVISKTPWTGWEHMKRTELKPYTGYNIPPEEYYPTFTHGSDEDMEWLKEHQIIFGEHKPVDPVTWGELSIVLHRLARRILMWVKEPSKKP